MIMPEAASNSDLVISFARAAWPECPTTSTSCGASPLPAEKKDGLQGSLLPTGDGASGGLLGA